MGWLVCDVGALCALELSRGLGGLEGGGVKVVGTTMLDL